jgi:phage terminase small subunit
MNRGPKPKTARNGGSRRSGRIHHETIEPTSTLGDIAKVEFWRLVEILSNRGSLDRVDLATVTECARIKERLDKAYLDDDTKIIPLMTSQRRGLLRELGLTIKPSTTLVKTVAKTPEAANPIKSLIKLA